MKRWFAVIGLTAALAIPSFAATTTWHLDPAHSNAQFVVRHMGISNVQGDFTKLSGTVVLDDQDISKSSVMATVDMSSVDTRLQRRDDDLKSRFFEVATYPTMTFQSTKIEKVGEGKLKMTGNLTLHGVTKEVVFDVDGPTPPINQGGVKRGADATGRINRKDFGIIADPMTVGDELSITLDLEMVEEGTAPARGGRGGEGRGPGAPPATQP